MDFLIFDFLESKTKLAVKLDSYYIEYLLFRNILIVVTELDIYMINIQPVVVDSVIHLPDVFSNIEIDNDIARVSCSDGSEVDIRLKCLRRGSISRLFKFCFLLVVLSMTIK